MAYLLAGKDGRTDSADNPVVARKSTLNIPRPSQTLVHAWPDWKPSPPESLKV